MLELAAKAVGIDLWHEDVFTKGLTRKVSDNGILCWNPLEDDGDALRLAVKLEMMVDTMNRVVAGYLSDVNIEIDYDEQEEDPEAAVRLAIVRAAAEVGRKM